MILVRSQHRVDKLFPLPDCSFLAFDPPARGEGDISKMRISLEQSANLHPLTLGGAVEHCVTDLLCFQRIAEVWSWLFTRLQAFQGNQRLGE